MHLWLLFLLATGIPGDNSTYEDVDTLVICPPAFQVALKPWLEYRKQQGYRIQVQTPSSNSNGIADQIQGVAQASPLKNVVLIGDAADSAAPKNQLVPTGFVAAKVNVKFGSELEIASDHSYVDMNNDGIVDLNIGRIPVDSASQLTNYINRVIEYESRDNSGDWQRKINFIAGVGGFGNLVDKMIEQSVKKIVTDLIPPAYNTTMAYGSWRSPYCPDPRRFSETTISRFNEGCLFWIYVGHGDRNRLDRVKMPDRQFDILDNRTVSKISAQTGPPIAIFLSCYTAAIDAAQDGLGERVFNQSRGPVAVISATRVSMPYAMSIFSLEMLDGYFRGEAKTLGELVKQSKQRMVQFDPGKSEYHQLVDSLGKAFSPEPGLLEDERKEHVHLMHLLGDPLLELQRPQVLELKAPAKIDAGQTVTVSGIAKHAGKLELDLAYRRDRFRVRPPRRKKYEATHASFTKYQEVFNQAQELVCSKRVLDVESGAFELELQVPGDCSGECFIRGLLKSNGSIAVGSSRLFVNANK